MDIDAIFMALREHDGDIRVANLHLKVKGYDRLSGWLQDELREHRYEIVRRLGMAGCPLATDQDVRDLQCWLNDGTLAWAGQRGVVIVPGWEYNERSLLQMARNYLDWFGTGSASNETFLQWTKLIVDRVRALLDDTDGHSEAPVFMPGG